MPYKILKPSDVAVDRGKHEFALAVLHGLWAPPGKKNISSRFFYDDRGSEIFREITDLPEYYLTGKEKEILSSNGNIIAEEVGQHPFRLVELGSGDGHKTSILIEEMMKRDVPFTYVPIDISEGAIRTLEGKVTDQFPEIKVDGIVSEYFPGLHYLYELDKKSPMRNLVLFLGSNVGNFGHDASTEFFKSVWYALKPRDFVLTGFDLRSGNKPLDVLKQAYNDSQGVTARFNLNLLERINRELSGDFAPETFEHNTYYDSRCHAMCSELVSSRSQSVNVNELNSSFNFEPQEGIHLERSHKYTQREIQELAKISGFDIVETFTDSDNWFADSLWRVRK